MTDGARPIRTLFVANRGEIATRIVTTAERLGIATVVPSLDGSDAVDLLSAGSVAEAALAAGADAVHPGYGFLAEDPALATGTPSRLAMARASALSPSARIAAGGGPTHVRPAARTEVGSAGASARNP